MLGNRLDAHRPRGAVSFACQAEDQLHGFGLDGIDLQCLLGAVATLLGGFHDAVADRRQRAVPEALARILLHRSQRMLGVLLGLVFVEQRHDLADHVAHRIVAELLGDRHQAHTVLGEPAHVELQLELVAEEAAEAVDQDHVERRRLGGRRVNHALEFWPSIVGRGGAGLDIIGHDLPAARCAVAFRLTALVRDGKIAVGLPSRRDPEIERRPNRRRHGDVPLSRRQTTRRTGPQTRPRTRRSRLRSPARPLASHP
jgi:hypothetical protein